MLFPTMLCCAVCCIDTDVVVSVSRKTDASLWPALFSAVGSPSAVLELLLEAGSLTSAACFLIVVDRCCDRSLSGRFWAPGCITHLQHSSCL